MSKCSKEQKKQCLTHKNKDSNNALEVAIKQYEGLGESDSRSRQQYLIAILVLVRESRSIEIPLAMIQATRQPRYKRNTKDTIYKTT